MSVIDVKKLSVLIEKLNKLFDFYQTSNLIDINPDEFQKAILTKIGAIDAESEGFTSDELEWQRDLSLKYYWGHNHDFGDFRLEGRMGNRHFEVLADFLTFFPVSLDDFKYKSVFDIGCWTGGTTLLLAALADRVLALEEVSKYAETASFLAKSFGIDVRVKVEAKSLYDCNSEEYYEKFEIAYFPGVIYHLTDPLLALRILYNSLKTGGIILIESEGIESEQPYCRFDGSLISHSGTKEELNRIGWNWFLPSAFALKRMMEEAGFVEIQTLWHDKVSRVYGYGRKRSFKGICKAGLSVRDIR